MMANRAEGRPLYAPRIPENEAKRGD
jgi:hypothetical protein